MPGPESLASQTPGASAPATRAPDAPVPAAVGRRVRALAALFAVQALCAVFFVGDVAADLLDGSPGESGRHLGVELVAALGLVAGLGFTGLEVRRLLLRQRRVEDQLRAASGAFLDLLEEHFEGWGLTPSERDVAMLAIKGLSTAEIAAVRETRAGTVKAQLAAIYQKAGVSGRPQLLSLFVEELMQGPIAGRAGG